MVGFTFAILAHNERATIGLSITQALQAAHRQDRVLVVDSASTDATGEVARAADVEVISGPIGKGAAMAVAIGRCETEWICFLDADYLSTERNIPAALRRAAVRHGVDQVIGAYQGAPQWLVRNSYGGGVRPIHQFLHATFFPDVALAERPLAGARAVNMAYLDGELPANYGIEAHINIEVGLRGGRSCTTPVGRITTQMKENHQMGLEVADTVLGQAIRHGRLDRRSRSAWLDWLAPISAAGTNAYATSSMGNPADEAAFRSALTALLARPHPG